MTLMQIRNEHSLKIFKLVIKEEIGKVIPPVQRKQTFIDQGC